MHTYHSCFCSGNGSDNGNYDTFSTRYEKYRDASENTTRKSSKSIFKPLPKGLTVVKKDSPISVTDPLDLVTDLKVTTAIGKKYEEDLLVEMGLLW